ncbi:MAG: RNA methyltransferase [Oscillospiraceae bacterium]|jgi:TrmH family RNA methyltransferase|nr:RNA methyltransferase [Oscillospiraceae bacterium]
MIERIASKENAKIKAAVRLRESARERREQGRFFLEGYRLCTDAMASGYVPEILYCTDSALQKYGIKAANTVLISEEIARKLGDTKTPQGIFGVFNAQKAGDGGPFWRPDGRYIALENVQDPGNFGAIARTAEALGLSGLAASGGCDAYHPKALRASMGALLRLPVLLAEDLPAALAGSGLPCYAAVPDRTALPLPALSFPAGAVIAVGNEGAGLSGAVLAACRYQITIPMPGRAESLNAAAAATIFLWELCKKAS